MSVKTKSNLQNHVDSIAHDLNNGMTTVQNNGFDYLSDVLDIQYIVTSEKQYIGARVLVAFGGPNIWINTQTKTIEGYWWDESAFASYYEDTMNLDEALEELWNCS